MIRSKSGFTKFLCKGLVLAFIISMLVSPMPAFAKTETSDPAKTLLVNILNPDGTTTLVHDYSYEELAPLEEIEYYATIDALPTGVGTKAKGVKISKLIEDAQKYNSAIKWESGQKLVFYVTDYPTVPYQGNNYYTYDFLSGQERYYFPHLVQNQDNDEVDYQERVGINLKEAIPVEPMLASSSYQERWATHEILEGIGDEQMESKESFRFCMGITEEEARDPNFSSTNKFGRWVYRVDVGPVNGARLRATKDNNEVGQTIEMKLTKVPDGWYEAVTQVKVDEKVLDQTQYEITEGKLTINPGVFNEPGDYEVTIEANGFMNSAVTQEITQNCTVTFMNDGEVHETKTVEAGQTLEAPTAPTKEGHTFDGWYEDKELNNKATFPYEVTKDLTFYAKWTEGTPAPAEHTITFMSDGVVYKTKTVEAGQTLEAPTAPTKEGYTFDGWYEDEELNNKVTFPYEVTKDITFYAKWTEETPAPSTYNINIAVLSGGTIKANLTTAKEGDTIALTITPEIGKRLAAGSLKYTTDGESYTEIKENSFTMPASDVTITGRFESIYQYTVNPQEDAAVYEIGQTTDGIKIVTVKDDIEGLTYFKVDIASSGEKHEGKETAVFVHFRDGKQLSINTTVADFDIETLNEAAAGFNVKAGDVVKVYLVDELTNDDNVNPIVLQ